jgi:hypothetical protein
MSIGRLVAAPQRKEEKEKMMMHEIKNRFRPKYRESQPLAGSTMALETR